MFVSTVIIKESEQLSLHYEKHHVLVSMVTVPVLVDTVDSCYLEFQGTHWNTSRYPYLDISELRKWGKQ